MPAPDTRVTDHDREETAQRLQQAFATGSLAPEEMHERLELALTARTRGDLDLVTADLPDDPAVELRSSGGRVKRSGQWRVPRRLQIVNEYGGAHLNLARAVIEHPVIEIDLKLAYGGAQLILPRGATVNADGVQTEWGASIVKVPDRGASTGPHFVVTGQLGYGRLKVKTARWWH